MNRSYQLMALHEGSKIDFHKAITKLPFEMHLPGHSFTGPGTRLDKRLDANNNPITKPINRVDKAAMHHDIRYRDAGDNLSQKHTADRQMIEELDAITDPTIRERIERVLVKNAMKTKLAIGASLSKELHRPYRKPKDFLKVKVYNKNDIWTADIMFLNNPRLIALVVMDCYTRYLWVEVIPNKNASTVKEAFQRIILKADTTPKKLWTDRGTEFYNRILEPFLKQHDIEIYSTYNEGKAVMAERVIRTIKEKMFRLKTDSSQKIRTWKPLLEQVVEKYNNTIHSSIRETPSTAYNDPDIIRDIMSDHNFTNTARKLYKFKVGDRVRIFKYKNKFEKGYTAKWTSEIFIITKVLDTSPVTYQIEDENGEPILGRFYNEELQKSQY